MVDSTTVAFVDGAGGRLVVVDLMTGRGWDVDDHGGSGPGESGGGKPFFTENDGRIHTVTWRGQAATFDKDGALVETSRYEIPFEPHPELPLGILRSGALITAFESPADVGTDGEQVLPRTVAANAPGGGRIWSYEGTPPAILQVRNGDARPQNRNGGLVGDARGDLIVLAEDGQTWLLVLGPDGREVARADIGHEVARPFIDADERIWVALWTPNGRERATSLIVYDRALQPLMQVTEGNVHGASGDFLLARSRGRFGESLLHLLRARRR